MAFSCFLVGTGALLVQCGERLLGRGHRVMGVVSEDPRLERWAGQRGLRFVSAALDATPVLAEAPFDYLFSIVNPRILPGGILRLPVKLAINYHDSPLPAHAGFHSTTWALLAGEPAHGISWHVMAERVDSGDLLRWARFAIAPRETVFSLNMKCYEAAVRAFTELLDDIEGDRLAPCPQDLDRRSFHRWADRPPAGGVFSWQRTAEEMDRLVRALDFATTPNPLLCPKLVAGGRFFLVRRLDVLDSPSIDPPGTVGRLGGGALVVATKSRDVALSGLATVDGKPIATGDFIAALRLQPGSRFVDLDAGTADRLTRLSSSLAPAERSWAPRLADLQPLSLPGPSRPEGGGEAGGGVETLPVALPAEMAALADRLAEPDGGLVALTTAFAVALSRLSGRPCFDVGYRGWALAREIAGLESFFAGAVPLRLDLTGADRGEAAGARVSAGLAWAHRHGTYARDLVARSAPPGEPPPPPPRFDVLLDAGDGAARRSVAAALTLAVGPGQLHLRYRAAAVDRRWIAACKERLEELLETPAAISPPSHATLAAVG